MRCRDALCGAECAFATGMQASDCGCVLWTGARAAPRALFMAAARNEPGQPTLPFNEYLLSVENEI